MRGQRGTMPQRNLICVSVDGLQAGMLGPYGNAWVRTPAVNRLAAQSLVFDQAFACQPSRDAAITVLWPAGVFGDRPATLLSDDAAACAHPSSSVFSDTVLNDTSQEHHAAVAIEDTQFALLMGQAIEWLSQAREPFCLWIHSRGMAGGWDAPYELRQQYADEGDPLPPKFVEPPERILPADYDPDELLGTQQAYAGQVSAFDECLGALLGALDESPFDKNTLFVLMGMRGYPLGEHLRVGMCDAALYNELTHVPLIVRYPDGAGALTRTQALVTHSDMPLLLRGEQLPWRDHLVFRSEHDRAIRTTAWYLRTRADDENQSRELYVKPDDRYEASNVANRCREIVTQLAEVLELPPGAATHPLPEALVTSLD